MPAVEQYLPTPALVGVGLVKAVLTPFSAVAIALPNITLDNTWAGVDSGFVTVQPILPRGTDIDVPQRRTSGYQLDAWATAGGDSNKPLWNRAEQLAELVRVASESKTPYGSGPIALALPNNHDPARVLSWWLMSEPTRIPDDPSGYARVSLDLAIDWVRP